MPLTPDYLKTLPDPVIRILYDVEDFAIADIARRIRKMGTATSTAELQRIALQALGEGTEAVNRKIADALGVMEEEVERIFAESEEIATDNQAQIAEGMGIALDDSFAQRIGEAAVQAAKGDLANLTRTAGYVMQDGQFTLWTDAYRQALSLAQMQIASGVVDYNTAVRQAIKPFTQQGMSSIGYASGRRVSIEAAARQAILGGVSDMANEVMKKNAADLGTDGWEISAHIDCAPDHEPYQGRQYSNEEYEQLNNSLARPIGTLNCRHIAYPVLLGISEPMYSETQLREMRRKNADGITYEGKHYTLYEADQMQRRLERAIRKTKRELIGYEGAGLKDEFTAASIKLRRQRDYYADFSDKAGLVTRNELLQVGGYGRSMSGKALYAEKNAFTDSKNGGIIKSNNDSSYEQAGNGAVRITELVASRVTEKIKAGEYSTKLSHQQYLKHRVNTPQYEEYKKARIAKGGNPQSILTVSEEEAQKIIKDYAGTGIIRTDTKGKETAREWINVNKVIGAYWGNGRYNETTKAIIHYGKKSAHIVPIRGDRYD